MGGCYPNTKSRHTFSFWHGLLPWIDQRMTCMIWMIGGMTFTIGRIGMAIHKLSLFTHYHIKKGDSKLWRKNYTVPTVTK